MTIYLIAAGTRIMNDKRFFQYYEVNEAGELGVSHIYSKRLKSFEILGMVYETERTEKGIQNWKVVSWSKFKESSAAYAAITGWSVAERVAMEELAGIQRAKKEYGRSVDLLIKELKDATWSIQASRQKRSAFARYVFEQLIK